MRWMAKRDKEKMGKRKNEIKKQEMDKRDMKEKRKSVAILAQVSKQGSISGCDVFLQWRHSCSVSPLCLCALFCSAASANPVNKVVQLQTDLEAKIKAEGVEAHSVHEEFAAWCKTQSSDLALAAWSFEWVSSDQDWRSRGQCRDNGGRLEGRCRNSCKGTCGLRKIAKGNCWTWSTRWEGRSPSSKRRWKEDLRWCNCRGLAASSRLSV